MRFADCLFKKAYSIENSPIKTKSLCTIDLT